MIRVFWFWALLVLRVSDGRLVNDGPKAVIAYAVTWPGGLLMEDTTCGALRRPVMPGGSVPVAAGAKVRAAVFADGSVMGEAGWIEKLRERKKVFLEVTEAALRELQNAPEGMRESFEKQMKDAQGDRRMWLEQVYGFVLKNKTYQSGPILEQKLEQDLKRAWAGKW